MGIGTTRVSRGCEALGAAAVCPRSERRKGDDGLMRGIGVDVPRMF